MKREFARRMQTITGRVPSRVASALLLGAWVALAALFTFVGNVVLLAAVTAIGQSLGPATLLLTVFSIFSTPAISLVLAERVVADAVSRFEHFVWRHGTDSDRVAPVTCVTDNRGRCRTSSCC